MAVRAPDRFLVVPDDGFFDEAVAARYDESDSGMFAAEVVDPTVDFLAEIAGGGRALELAIGTGRIALPLAARGVEVHGIELSNAMVARLRAKPGGADLPITIGDFTSARADGTFALAYLVFNTIQNVTTQEKQVATFHNVGEHLDPGGCFVIEVEVPTVRSMPPGERFHVFASEQDHWGIDEYDLESQAAFSHHFELIDGRWGLSSMPFRYVWPTELDLMAELAGMRLRERWAGWQREPFTADSRGHVSVWEKPAG